MATGDSKPDEGGRVDLAASLGRIFSQCLEAIFVISQETGRFIYASEGAQRDTGYSLEELSRMSPLDLQPGATFSDLTTRTLPLIKGEIEVSVFETAYRRKDGTVYPVEHRLQYLRSEHPPAFLVIARDLSNRPDLVAGVHQDADVFRRLVDQAEAGVWMIDQDGITTFANGKMAGLLGYSQDEMMGMHLLDFVEGEAKVQTERDIQRRKDNIAEQMEVQIKRKDGSYFWALVETNPLRDDAGRFVGAVAFISDVTVRKDAEAALREHDRELEARLQAMQQRFGEAALALEPQHEILPSAGLIDRAAKQFSVLSDPRRLRILNEILLRHETTVTALAARVELNQSNVSKHLKILTEAGMLTRRQSGREIFYSLTDQSVITLCEIVRNRLETRARAELDALSAR